MTTTQQKGKRGEFLVFGELLRRGADLYLPAIDTGYDAILRRKDGTYVEIQVKATEAADQAGWFNVYDLGTLPARHLFIVCVDMSKQPPESWIFPAKVFMKYSTVWTSKKGWKRYTLGLGAKDRAHGNKLRQDLLVGYREAWHQLTP